MQYQIPLPGMWIQMTFDVGPAMPHVEPDCDEDYDDPFDPEEFSEEPAGPQLVLLVHQRVTRCPVCGAEIQLGPTGDPEEDVACLKSHQQRERCPIPA